MTNDQISVQEVDYVSTAIGTMTSDDAPIVVVTIRPDANSYRPHNIAFPRKQAERLMEDLKKALQLSVTFFLLLALICASGCSSDVEVERETTTTDPATQQTTTERERTAVAVELGRDQTVLLTPSGDPVNLPSDVDYVIVDGCVHVHEHIHVYAGKNDRAEQIAIEVLRGLQEERCKCWRCR